MEVAYVKIVAERGFGARPQRQDLELTDLIGQRLSRHHDVAVDLVDDVVLRLGCVVLEEIDGLLPRPSLVVEARVDDQPHGTPHVVR